MGGKIFCTLRKIRPFLILAIALQRQTYAEDGPPEVGYKISADHIYKTIPNVKNRPLNPDKITIVKKISLRETRSAVRVLSSLIERFNSTCQRIRGKEQEETQYDDFQTIIGKYNISSAKEKCEREGKRLIEIQEPGQLLGVLQKLEGEKSEFPAGVRYSQSIDNFVFLSNDRRLSSGPVTTYSWV